MDDDADGESEEAVDLAHPLRISLREVIIHGDDVDSAAGEGVEIAGEGGDEGLAFAGLHLGDLALVEDHAADELDVEVAHADGALAGLADDGEGLGEDGVEGGFSAAYISSACSLGSKPETTEAIRCLNSAVLSRSWSSERAWMVGSSALTCATRGIRRLMARSLLVPKTLLIRVLIKTRSLDCFRLVRRR